MSEYTGKFKSKKTTLPVARRRWKPQPKWWVGTPSAESWSPCKCTHLAALAWTTRQGLEQRLQVICMARSRHNKVLCTKLGGRKYHLMDELGLENLYFPVLNSTRKQAARPRHFTHSANIYWILTMYLALAWALGVSQELKVPSPQDCSPNFGLTEVPF